MSLTIVAGLSADIPTTVALSPTFAASCLNCFSVVCQAGTNEKPSTNQRLYCFPLFLSAAPLFAGALRLDEAPTTAVIATKAITAKNPLCRMEHLLPKSGLPALPAAIRDYHTRVVALVK